MNVTLYLRFMEAALSGECSKDFQGPAESAKGAHEAASFAVVLAEDYIAKAQADEKRRRESAAGRKAGA